MECYILTAEIKQAVHRRLDPTEIKQFINFIESILPKWQNLLYSNSMFNLNKEFECAVASLKAGFELLFQLEEQLLSRERPFILQYVITYGDIEVPKRKGMFRGIVGNGLLKADIRMQKLRESKDDRFNNEIKDRVESLYLNGLFSLYQMICDSWSPKDYKLAYGLIFLWDYKLIAKGMNKDAALVWKRRKALKIRQYDICKELILKTPELIVKKKASRTNEKPPAF